MKILQPIKLLAVSVSKDSCFLLAFLNPLAVYVMFIKWKEQ